MFFGRDLPRSLIFGNSTLEASFSPVIRLTQLRDIAVESQNILILFVDIFLYGD